MAQVSVRVVFKGRDHNALVIGSERGDVLNNIPIKIIRELLQFSYDISDSRNSTGRLPGITEAASLVWGSFGTVR